MKFLKTPAFAFAAVLLFMGCGDAPDPAVESQAVPNITASSVDTRPIPPSRGFSWIVPGELAAMPLPGRDRPLEEDAAFLEQEGIRILVSLTENPPDFEVLASRAIHQEDAVRRFEKNLGGDR